MVERKEGRKAAFVTQILDSNSGSATFHLCHLEKMFFLLFQTSGFSLGRILPTSQDVNKILTKRTYIQNVRTEK